MKLQVRLILSLIATIIFAALFGLTAYALADNFHNIKRNGAFGCKDIDEVAKFLQLSQARDEKNAFAYMTGLVVTSECRFFKIGDLVLVIDDEPPLVTFVPVGESVTLYGLRDTIIE